MIWKGRRSFPGVNIMYQDILAKDCATLNSPMLRVNFLLALNTLC